MFNSDSAQGDLNGFLDAGSHIKGELRFDDTFRIDGKLTGKVTSKGELVVGERGEVDGDLAVGTVYVSGTVRGKVRASVKVEVTASGHLLADIETPALVIEDGAHFEGQCSMVRAGEKGARRGSQERPVVARIPIPKDG